MKCQSFEAVLDIAILQSCCSLLKLTRHNDKDFVTSDISGIFCLLQNMAKSESVAFICTLLQPTRVQYVLDVTNLSQTKEQTTATH